MNIARIDEQAFNWNGMLFSKIYTQGCNFRCGYCFVPELLDTKPGITSDQVMVRIKRSNSDGVCVSGGEPTIQKDLPIFLKRLKLLGLKIMLETNGSNPEMLEKLVKRKLIDFVRLDVKAPPEKYREVTGKDSWDLVLASLGILESWDGYWEAVTVWHPGLTKEDLIEIGERIKGKWVIAEFQTGSLVDPRLNRVVEVDEEFLAGIPGPREIWVRTKEHERRLR